VLYQDEDDEDTYTLLQSRASPRLEWRPLPSLSTFAFYRADYDVLNDVKPQVKAALPGAAPHFSTVSGLGFGVDWNETDDFINPTRGWELGGTVEPIGGILGGDVSILRLIGEGRIYQPLGGHFLGTARVRVGAADPLGSTTEVPFYERFWAGGINSVRGYGRRRIGPRADNEPLGGRTLAEASIELRHPITDQLTGLIFLDGGQVSLATFDFPFGDLQYGSGFGVRYASPIGPVGFDVGFPFSPPDGDQHWQVYFSVGRAF
jgi:outer membrane protein assembly factor BamA